jgi:hypothetical protein
MRILSFALKLSFSIALTFVLLEVVMTVADPLISQGFYQYDPEVGFRVRAHMDGSNEFGFNAPDFPHDKPPGIFRVLVLGDSFNWIGGLQGNYTALLQRRFDEWYGARRVEIINAGYPMTHPAEQLPILRRYGLQYHPDLVVLGFFAGNDFFDGSPHRKRIVVNDTFVDIDPADELVVFGRPIVFQSRFLLFVRQKWTAFVATGGAGSLVGVLLHPFRVREAPAAETAGVESPAPTPAPAFSEPVFLDIERSRLDFFNVKTGRGGGHYREAIDYILGAVTAMRDLLVENKIGFAVAIYPDQVQVENELFETIVKRYRLRAYRYQRDMAERILGAHLESLGVPFIAFLDRFRERSMEESLYLPRDTHWNAAGNALAADLLFEFLGRFVPPRAAAASG